MKTMKPNPRAGSTISHRIIRQPTQQRSRDTLEQIVAAAVTVLQRNGEPGFTIAKVAAEAGVSAGVLYSNFKGKSQLILAVKDLLLEEVESSVTSALSQDFGSMEAAILTYTRTLAAAFDRDGLALRNVINPHVEAQTNRGALAWNNVRNAFYTAVVTFSDEIGHPSPGKAIRVASRTITGTMIHATSAQLDDDMSWDDFAHELAIMAGNYLRSTPQ